ncbi:MAG: DUF805 domain-containing protein [Clostridia bacterium]|nr:DUF805 domain-containing protein [Clostridia bacterium]
MRYYIDAFKNYNKKDGRATRREYLFFVLFNCIFIFCFSFLDAMLETYPTITTDYNEYSMKYGYFTIVYLVIQACPCICLQVRRLHDVGKSEKWWFVGCVPFFNFYMVYLYLKVSDAYVNKYGAPININQKYRANIKVDTTEHTDEEIIYNEKCSNIDDNEAEKVKLQKTKSRFCKFCGGQIDAQTKKCGGCGKQYFKGIKFNKFLTTVLILSLVIILSIISNIVQLVETNELNTDIEYYKQKSSEQQTKISSLNKEIKEKDSTLDFFDRHVVFVEDDGTKLYHKYGCYKFKGKSFWAFNIEAAKGDGYYACSECSPGKTTSQTALDKLRKKYGLN